MTDHIYTLIIKHLRQETSREEEQALIDWLHENEENRRFYTFFVANLSLHETQVSPDFEERRERMVNRLGARIEEETVRKKKGGILKWISFTAVAAAVAVIGIFLHRSSLPDKTPELQSFVNTSAVIKAVTLGDHTRICLKPGSSIRFNVTEIPNQRIVELDGAGYFDVAKDSLRPFTVKTRDLLIRVLGTSFTVNSTSGYPNTEVVLEKGSVRLLSPEGTSLVCLTPNQKALYNSVTGDITIDALYAIPFVIQQYNLISFSNATLAEIVEKLEKLFGVKIQIDNRGDTKRYDINFLKSDSLQDVLSMIEFLTGRHLTLNSH